MSHDAGQLLRSLAAGVHSARPDVASSSRAFVPLLAGQQDFASLLQRARAGDVSSGLEVRLPRDLGVELTSEQLARLRTAADRAEAHGASQALFAMDGMLLRMDIPTRTVTGIVDPDITPVVDGIDAFVRVASGLGSGTPAQVTPITGELAQLPLNASVLEVLAKRDAS